MNYQEQFDQLEKLYGESVVLVPFRFGELNSLIRLLMAVGYRHYETNYSTNEPLKANSEDELKKAIEAFVLHLSQHSASVSMTFQKVFEEKIGGEN